MPLTSVTENHVTIVANDTEENIRASAGFKPREAETATAQVADGELDEQPVDASPEPAKESDRDEQGRFKAKDEPSKAEVKPKAKEDKYGGDPRKSLLAKAEFERQGREKAEREAAELRQRLIEREQPSASVAGTVATPAPQGANPASKTYIELLKQAEADPNYPKLEDFIAAGFADPYAACTAAQTAFLQDQRSAAAAKEAAKTAAEREVVSTRAAIGQRGADKYADWNEAIQAVPTWPDVLDAEIRANDSSEDLIYHLATNPDDLAPLVGLTDPIAVARAVAKLSTRLIAASSGPAETTPRGSRAKPLIKPVSASLAAPEASPPDPQKSTFKQWTEYMNAEERRQQRGARGA